MKLHGTRRSFQDTGFGGSGITLLLMLCSAHASSLNWAPDPDISPATSTSPSPPPPLFPNTLSSNPTAFRSLRGRRLGSATSSETAGFHHKSEQSPWTIIPAKKRNITSTSATAIIRRKNSRDNNFRPVNATSRALTGSKQDPDDALVNGEFVSKKVIVALSCEPEETVVKFNFTSPFRGVIQAGGSHSPCRIKGDGRRSYYLGVPHSSCGTKHVLLMLCSAHASSLNWAPDPDISPATSTSPSPPPPLFPNTLSSNPTAFRSLRGRRLGSATSSETAGFHHKSEQSPWTIIPAKRRNITSATAIIRRKNSRDNNFRPVNATSQHLLGVNRIRTMLS